MADGGKVNPVRRGLAAGMASAVWSAVGGAFFRELAKHLSAALGAHLVYIGEVCHEPLNRMSTLAASQNGTERENFDYYLAGTASAELLARGMNIYERGIRRSFPSDPTLEGADAFAGKALYDSVGQPIGAMIALWRHPLVDSSAAVAMFEAFAPRAAAELERKLAEDHLRESEQRYHAFISNSKDGMWRLEFEEPIPTGLSEDEQIDRMYRYGYIAECNDATARIWGVPSPDVLIGARLGQLAPRTEAHVEDLRNVIRSGYKADNVEVRLIDKKGNRAYRIRSHLGIIEKGQLLRVWVTTRDVGDLKRAELEWQASERRFRQLLETIRMAAVMLDPSGRVTFCNDYLLAITGRSKDNVLGRDFFDLVPDENRDLLRVAFSNFLAEGEPHQHLEAPLMRRDGTRRVIEWDSTHLRDGEGKIVGAASLGRDVTDQRALEARLREADKLESVRKLAGAIAHDFNNLLTIVRGFASVLLEAHESDPLRGAAEQVIRASEQGAALTRQLLSFSRDQPVKPRPLQVNKLIVENEAMLRRLLGDDVELVCDLDPSVRTVLADPGQIHQVLVNLAMNAHDAMPDGGKLTITSRETQIGADPPPAMQEVQPGTYVMLAIADTGVGMPEEVRSHVFEPFFTTKRGRGTGLGLASVYGIVRQSGGYVSVDSTPGNGSTFYVLLPALPEGRTAARPERVPAAREEPETVLLVDDEAALRGLAARGLRNSGYEVVEAGTGRDALSVAESYPKRIDLLLTDLSMPDMDGSDLAKRLKAAHPDLKVLYMSGYTESLPGDAAYIQKPFTTRALAEKVRDVLGTGNK